MFLGHPPQKLIARLPGRLLEIEALFLATGPNIHLPAYKRNGQTGGGFSHEKRILLAFGPQPMVQVGDHQPEAVIRAKLPENVQKGHGIRASRDADNHPVPRLEHIVFLNGPADHLRDGFHGFWALSS